MDKDYHSWILTIDEEMIELELALSGKKYDAKNGVFVQDSEPLLNEVGVKEAKLLFKSLIGKHAYLSNISQSEFKSLLRSIMVMIIKTLIINKKSWGYKSEKLMVIVGLFINYIDLALRRAVGESDKKFVVDTMRTERRVIQNEGQQQPQGYYTRDDGQEIP